MLCLLAAALTWPASAQADTDRAAARSLGGAGVQAYQSGDYETAHQKLSTAYQVLQAPSLALWNARSLRKLGHLVEAAELYLEATRLPVESGGNVEIQKKAQSEAEAERQELLPLIPTLQVVIENSSEGEPLEVTVSGAALNTALIGSPVPTDPGDVKVLAIQGDRQADATIVLAEGETKTVTLKLPEKKIAPAPTPLPNDPIKTEPSPMESAPSSTPVAAPPTNPARDQGTGDGQRTAGWITIGVGGLGVAVGAGTGLAALLNYNDLDCPNDVCSNPADESTVNTTNTLRTVSSIGLIAGVVLVGTGATLVLTAPRDDNSTYVAPYVAGSTFGLKGAF